jgi:5-methylcytosine-specific restriction enzyme A
MNEATKHKFYTSVVWKRERKNKLCNDPFCEIHLKKGELVIAEDVHHLVPISKDWSLRLVYSNLQSLCHSCHSLITVEEQKEKPKGGISNMKWKI